MKKIKYDEALLGKYTDTDLANLTGKDYGFIWRHRTKLGIPTYTSKFGHSPKYKYDIYAFDKIDEISAYWLGLYFSDGCICETGRRKIISLGISDYDVIKKLAEFYQVSKKLITKRVLSKNKNFYTLQLCNSYLFDKLLSLGCYKNKSFILEKPNIDKKYYIPFLMGFYDGDGSLSVNKSINSWKCGIGSASKNIFDWIVSIIDSYGYSKSVEVRKIKNGNFYCVSMCGITAKAFLGDLYKSVPNFLPMKRKKKLYKQFCNVKLKSNPSFFNWEIDYINLELNDTKCSELINNDTRNYGWIRKPCNITKKRISLINSQSTLQKAGNLAPT